MEKKRKQRTSSTLNDKVKKQKSSLSKESFMAEIQKIQLYNDQDEYYRNAKTNIGPLELNWR